MVRLITRGSFTHDYAKGLVSAPEDREPIVKKLVESVGAKLSTSTSRPATAISCLSVKVTMPNPSPPGCWPLPQPDRFRTYPLREPGQARI
jgi:hypothetical protein